MLIYVAHAFSGKQSNIRKAAKITHDLQLADPENTYICPLLAFSHLKYNELGYEREMELCMDLLSECISMVVSSEISKGVQLEIDYCNEWNMPIRYVKVTYWLDEVVNKIKEWFECLSR